MDSKINLIEKYFEGNTSIQEEQLLRSYFQNNIDEEALAVYKPLFEYLDIESKKGINDVNFVEKTKIQIVEKLLELYFEGETSISDERVLKSYFSGDAVAENLKEYSPIFTAVDASQMPILTVGFDQKLEVNLIKSTLESYFDGESSLEDETVLKEYFAQNNVDESLKKWQPLFQTLNSEQKKTVSDNFEIKLQKQLQTTDRQPIIRKINFRRWAAAAMVALAIGVFFLMDFKKEKTSESVAIDWSKYEPQNPEEAYQKTLEALALVSAKMKKGEEQTLKGFSKIKQANEAVGL